MARALKSLSQFHPDFVPNPDYSHNHTHQGGRLVGFAPSCAVGELLSSAIGRTI